MGRPLKFETVEELQNKIDEWLNYCSENNKPLTITGLAIALNTTRETLLDYEEKDAYSDTVIKAKQMCEQYVEEYLFTGKNVAGAIFNLINNYKRWKNRQETEHTGEITQKQYVITNGESESESLQSSSEPEADNR